MPDKDVFGDDPRPRDSNNHDAADDQADTDAVWAQIVASFHASPDEAVPRWPAAEDVAPDSADQVEEVAPASVDGPAEPAPEGFVPPPPPPLPRGDAVSWAAWSGVLGGPAYLLVAAITASYVPTWLGSLAVGGFVGGFIVLVARMRDRNPDGPDDGAVV